MFETLARDERLLLLRFVCAFAWTDLEVRNTERAFVHRLVERLELGPEDASEVETWLHVAPAPGSVDPKDVPPAHRRTFIEAVRAMMYVDGEVEAEEREQFERLKAALLG
jgi:uncharacterized tellurite resistance protein B-like protein